MADDQEQEGTAPDAAQSWSHLLALVAEHGASLEAVALVEDFIDRHADAFVQRIEEQATKDLTFAELVSHAHLGDMAGPGVERVRLLQDALFERGDVGSRWQGWEPLRPEDFQ